MIIEKSDVDDLHSQIESLRGIVRTYMNMHEEDKFTTARLRNKIVNLTKENKKLKSQIESWNKAADCFAEEA